MMHETLTRLRHRIDALAPVGVGEAGPCRPVTLGADALDRALGGALMRGALHECVAPRVADMGAMAGFAAGLAHRIGAGRRRIVWIRQAITEIETGRLYAPGLAAMGLDPSAVVFVQLRRAEDVLRAGLEAVRCAPLGAVLIEVWSNPRVLDLTATRRLGLAARGSGVTPLLLRVAAEPQPSSAATRWQVAAAPSRALAANAPGDPAVDITLLRNRAGAAGGTWRVEWDHDRQEFRDAAPLSGAVVSVSGQRQAAPPGRSAARAS